MRRKALLTISVVMATVMLLCVPASAITVKKSSADPYFGKYDKPVTVNMAVATNIATVWPKGESYSNNVWTKSYKSDLNINVNIKWSAVGPPNGNYETKINLAIASNDLPDIMNLSNYSQFDRLNKAGKLTDLTPYYGKYAYPLLKKNLSEGGGVALEWGKIGGKLMGLSTESVNYSSVRMVYIRRDWFVKSGLAKPKTMEDVLAIAKAFKAQDPEKRFGIALNKAILTDTFCDMVGIANSMGAYPRQWLDNGKGSLVYGSVQPAMKKTLQIYADMYKQGLIDPSFASIDGGKVGEQLTNGTVGVVFGAFWLPSWPFNSYYEKDGVEWDIYPLFKSTTFTGKLMEQTDSPVGKMLVVRKGYAHPEVLFKMLNYSVSKIYDPARAETLKFHSNPKFPGYGYFSYDPIQFLAGPIMTNFNSNPNVTNAIDKKDMSYLKSEHDKLQYPNVKLAADKIKAGTRATAGEWAAYKFFYGPNSTFGILNKYFTDNSYLLTKVVGYQSPEMIRSWQNLIKLEDQSFTEIISGIKPISDFDKFVTQWKDLGGEVVQYEVNSWYKEKMKK